ncbi:MAG: glycosyltransferase, partial [Turicibacter sp.]
MEPKRILHIVGRMNRGGQETFIMNAYRAMDRTQIQFDFIVSTAEICDYEEEILRLGGRIYRVTRKNDNVIKNFCEIYHLIKTNNYQVIHRHASSSIIMTDLIAAKLTHAKTIVHSHTTNCDHGWIHKLFVPLFVLFSDKYFACSPEAGHYLFGEKNFEKSGTVIPNGIDLKQYKFQGEARKKLRERHHLENNLIVGHIGRFTKVKNHETILHIFKEL